MANLCTTVAESAEEVAPSEDGADAGDWEETEGDPALAGDEIVVGAEAEEEEGAGASEDGATAGEEREDDGDGDAVGVFAGVGTGDVVGDAAGDFAGEAAGACAMECPIIIPNTKTMANTALKLPISSSSSDLKQ